MTNTLKKEYLDNYLLECATTKNLNNKTLKAYQIDLLQFYDFCNNQKLNKQLINAFITELQKKYNKPKTIKRKIASIKAFFNYLEFNEIIDYNPFIKLRLQFKEPFILPKTIDINTLTKVIHKAYQEIEESTSDYKKKIAVRNAAMIELLFSTGIRISELCNITAEDIDLEQGIIKIYGKGSKERVLSIGNQNVLLILTKYYQQNKTIIDSTGYFFINRVQKKISEQSMRILLNRYVEQLNLNQHITPHMFRHTFATQLLEHDVDIRYIQRILGHSSINTTQIYTHVSSNKQKEILKLKNPRNFITL